MDRTSTSKVGGSVRLARRILRDEGGLKGFYRGLAINLIGNSSSWALYFVWYDIIKRNASAHYGASAQLSSYDYFWASGLAGIYESASCARSTNSRSPGTLTAVSTNPLWVIKTRMLSTSVTHHGAYKSVTEGMQSIWTHEGVRGFYRGLLPSLFGVSHGALQFMAYEEFKKARKRSLGIKDAESLGNLDYLIFSGLSKALAGSATYPYQTIRSRLQTYDAEGTYKGAKDVVVQIWKQEGLPGFYKGLTPNLARVVPSSCITFLVYENVRTYLPFLMA